MKSLNRQCRPWERQKIYYLTELSLAVLRYDEWSAYGAGVLILTNNAEVLVQYYVPYLSAIQVLTSTLNNMGGLDTELGECKARDSFSDYEECESEKQWMLDWSFSEDGGSRGREFMAWPPLFPVF
ncbi:hypothetical protein CDL15_Pgr011059 [Punica granatum]|uniref:Uncharacterized protein n=1 Tax=Punica granatum TaxID=22663 RepID=A0A218XLV5_PUNGR|nr:hypothetical protein CDL15_Pgr011059 [Punica granatum]PKI44263.1 hypothetical protein CRG98_035337 [Punica granatum]